MPTLTLRIGRFSEVMGRYVSIDELKKWIPWIGVDIEDVGPDYIKIEYNPNRPDFGTPIGIARTYKGILREEVGPINYTVNDSNVKIFVDSSVSERRPYIAGIIIKGLKLTEDILEELIKFQEDLHIGLGRRRRKIAIGLHDLDKVCFPLYYTTVNPNFKFIPLDMDREMSIKEILDIHPKGVEYGHLVRSFDRYPIIIDSENKVLSLPPIINGAYTALTTESENIFVDVTGVSLRTLSEVVNLLATTLHDYGGKVYSVIIVYGDREIKYPDLRYRSMKVLKKDVRQILGLDLSISEIIDAIRAMRMDARYIESEDAFQVLIPPYRVDILHPRDIIEDIAIGYGMWRIEPCELEGYMIGRLSDKRVFEDKIADLLVGLGFQEVFNYILTDPDIHISKMCLSEDLIKVKSPKSKSHSVLRRWLIPSLLQNLSLSKKEEYPQKIFEIGHVVKRVDSKIEEEIHLAVAITHPRMGYTELKSYLDTLLDIIGISKYSIIRTEHPSFIRGRVGIVVYKDIELGIIGEIHPKVLNNFQLINPAGVFELNLDLLFEIWYRYSMSK